ncbi:DNA mismatch repair protein MutS [Brevibacillus centrosporus]|uniref:DNA mismatch repair protein MutS n=1 Tax=Brevibacillus centrosporus TaxID=54910 RepID=A0A1I3P2X7_9BACL|nr:DNA mismatch repair protein MutS [Brevibacillus centrosporus]MEC2128542.1 DNA mismatch repair protein MutS [Brevibacillus centrosporus]MED4909965.1 DNA mismatch repair protein MutS [Brevibacillus centrosporus]RNB73620.1 DNA mismatch repair protein MutS [Brevibacillus centrosporus]SFJ15687.1 DNA mismatch repair protein MutS [Brevibacillus centrosporus]GED29117.1 DNA mismatch repair protein MutS [Brevibacillus centrosporus]
MTAYTPMIQQYLAIKKDYPDTFLFFRLGDFYELFFDDAVLASRELEITLTGREGGGTERIPMCGVPHHAADTYIAELLKKGYKIAVCEQVEDPKEAKGVVRREVTRVVTPGTMMEGKWLTDKENNYMAAVAELDGRTGIAACDMSTGEMYVTSLVGHGESVIDEALQYRPKELVFCGLATIPKTALPHTVLDRNEIDAFAVDVQYQEQAKELDAVMRTAVNALLGYIGTTQKRSLAHMRLIKRYDARQYLQMDGFSRRNLELTETIRDKSKKGSLLWLLDRTETAMGGRLLRRWIERPLLRANELQARLDAVEALKGDLLLRSDVRSCLDRVYDLERLAGRISYGNANARDLIQLRYSLEAVPELKLLLKETKSPVLADLAAGMDNCADIVQFLQSALVDDPPISVREGGMIRTGYDEYLDKLHSASRDGKTWIAQLEQGEREATGIRSLKVGFNKVFGYYIEVSKSNIANVPAGRYERKQTLANAERYITPELKEREALILEAEEKMIELEYQLFSAVRSEVAQHIPRLQGLAERIASVDVLQSFATVSDERGYVRPELTETGEYVITEGRHPVVEAVLEREKYVANDARMDQQQRQVLLITGPNMAGKSTYMRQIALITVMAQVGCFVPAKSAKLALVDQIFTRIGAADDLAGGHSTFMVEMLETKHALQKATSQSLILLDEIGRGTSTYDGMALAQAVIEYICQKIGAKTLFSTHYHELTSLEETMSGVVNVHARCEERDGKLLFLHKIEEGRADKSYGIHVAELAEMPVWVIERARSILTGLEAGSTSAAAADMQMSLDMLWTAPAPVPAAVVKEEPTPLLTAEEEAILADLRELDLNQTTPMDAMLKLFAWKQQLKKG